MVKGNPDSLKPGDVSEDLKQVDGAKNTPLNIGNPAHVPFTTREARDGQGGRFVPHAVRLASKAHFVKPSASNATPSNAAAKPGASYTE